MKIPAKIRYAVRTLVEIGKSPDKVLPLAEVEKKQRISAKFTKQILQPLERKNIVGSKRGIKGGYFLKKEASEIRVKDVFEALGEDVHLAPCLGKSFICERDEYCGAKIIWSNLQENIEGFLEKITIQDIIENEGRF